MKVEESLIAMVEELKELRAYKESKTLTIRVIQSQHRIGSTQKSEFAFPYFILESNVYATEEIKILLEKVLSPVQGVINSAKKDNEQTIARIESFVKMLGTFPEDTQKLRDRDDDIDPFLYKNK